MPKPENNKEPTEETIWDHIFAITVVSLMFLFILSFPFFIFYGVIKLLSLTPYVSINSSSTFESGVIVFKFFIITVVTLLLVDGIICLIVIKKKGLFNLILEELLVFVVMYLYVLIYSLYSKDIVIKDIGVAIVSLSLFVLYLLIHVVDFVTEKLKSKQRNN
ncbi:hypothetical protein ERICIV_03952 [Paenibacillus larvae subsp. larvae]|uniref:Uncharacterized protein n=2 Tax=Paenibacillus larvae TaxID=1464 RepID=A0A2L1U5R8_9BACL|nr:hypothetical protein [Paenibacillus larvae]AQT84557.1 hypothetical protein B1222_09430 [Paenibacillus larvae subsp. pulvifaciens]AQZ46557.1 hypothetical protein B5S25_07970 [Paenibacillus larvae subsp. pulvifaciens]AVF28275.1 hypothetical protein ERICIII_04209 [Paenibacillus larvae subsp. larvae]AVF32778.1 hypothetical protein ERICIV_03952 [Paenibacillus larvae subsp. larvae]MBH0341531.1 hypothetical protein [Paenibacillus larvae]